MTKIKHLRIRFIIALLLITLLVFFQHCNLAEAVNSEVKKSDLVLVEDYSKDFIIDMKYATCDNFVGKTLYPSPTCVLTKGTLDKLIKANNIVKKQGYSIKIWDAYRPLSVQKIMWEATPNKNYVANPYRSGSKHNRGAAVDVTLVDKSGRELKMPTEFDNFTAKASPNYKGMTAEQRKNLNILSKAMKSSGFRALSHEWWHFEDIDYNNYKIQDVPLSKFDKTEYGLSSKAITELKFIKESNTSQLIVVTSSLSNSSNVVINTYEKNINGWVNIHNNITGWIGLKGFTTDKKEGDKKTPVGAFNIGTCFGKNQDADTGLNYYRYDSKDENFSKMKDGIYDLFFTIGYNQQNKKNTDSAIFFNIVKPNMKIKYTNGSVATERKDVVSIAKWLDKDKSPMILMGPLSEIIKY